MKSINDISGTMYAIFFLLASFLFIYKIATYEEHHSVRAEIKLPLLHIYNPNDHGHLHKTVYLANHALSLANNSKLMVWVSRDQYSIFVQYEDIELAAAYKYIIDESNRIKDLYSQELHMLMKQRQVKLTDVENFEEPYIYTIAVVEKEPWYVYILKLFIVYMLSLNFLKRYYRKRIRN
jgi:hypothetical protein